MTFADAHRVSAIIQRVIGVRTIMHNYLLAKQWFINVENFAVYHMWKLIVMTFLTGWSVAAVVYHV